MKNKGFTLIELLAVIVILAIILLIAVPQVLDVIEDVRIAAYKDNEKMVIKAAENYLAVNTSNLPNDIGSTSEIKVRDLTSLGFIDQVSDSEGSCLGYVLVTKTDDNDFSYNPEIRCGDSNTIDNTTDDKLVLYYDFEENSEYNDNLVVFSELEGHGSSWINTGYFRDGFPVYKNKIVNIDLNNNFGIRILTDFALDPNDYKYLTLSFDAKVIDSPGFLGGIRQCRIY